MSINGGAINSYAINAASNEVVEPQDISIIATIPELWSSWTLEESSSLRFAGTLPRLTSDFKFETGFNFAGTLPGLDSTFNIKPSSEVYFSERLPGLISDITLAGESEILFSAKLPNLNSSFNFGSSSSLSIECKLPGLLGEIYIVEPDNLYFKGLLPGLLSEINFNEFFSLTATLPGLDSEFTLLTNQIAINGVLPGLEAQLTLETYSFSLNSTLPGLTPNITLEERNEISIEARLYLLASMQLEAVGDVSFTETLPDLSFEGFGSGLWFNNVLPGLNSEITLDDNVFRFNNVLPGLDSVIKLDTSDITYPTIPGQPGPITCIKDFL